MIKSILIKGQIPLTVLLSFGGAVGGSVIWVYSLAADAQTNLATVKTDVAVLQNSITNTDTNVEEIKDDIKDIKRALNVK